MSITDSSFNDRWMKCISQGGNLRATAVTARGVVNVAKKCHKTPLGEVKTLGESLVAGLLLASTAKQDERISLSIKGSGRFKQAVIDASAHGTIRGFLVCRDSDIVETKGLGPWQNGLLSITRLKTKDCEPYVGTIETLTGHLAKDLTLYFSQSEQVPSSVGIEVHITDSSEVNLACGFLVQALPGASKAEVMIVENNILSLKNLASNMDQNSGPIQILSQVFSDLTFTILEESPLEFKCNCSKDRVARALRMLGRAELESMIQADHGAKVNCDFCSTEYFLSEDDLKSLY